MNIEPVPYLGIPSYAHAIGGLLRAIGIPFDGICVTQKEREIEVYGEEVSMAAFLAISDAAGPGWRVLVRSKAEELKGDVDGEQG